MKVLVAPPTLGAGAASKEEVDRRVPLFVQEVEHASVEHAQDELVLYEQSAVLELGCELAREGAPGVLPHTHNRRHIRTRTRTRRAA